MKSQSYILVTSCNKGRLFCPEGLCCSRGFLSAALFGLESGWRTPFVFGLCVWHRPRGKGHSLGNSVVNEDNSLYFASFFYDDNASSARKMATVLYVRNCERLNDSKKKRGSWKKKYTERFLEKNLLEHFLLSFLANQQSLRVCRKMSPEAFKGKKLLPKNLPIFAWKSDPSSLLKEFPWLFLT